VADVWVCCVGWLCVSGCLGVHACWLCGPSVGAGGGVLCAWMQCGCVRLCCMGSVLSFAILCLSHIGSGISWRRGRVCAVQVCMCMLCLCVQCRVVCAVCVCVHRCCGVKSHGAVRGVQLSCAVQSSSCCSALIFGARCVWQVCHCLGHIHLGHGFERGDGASLIFFGCAAGV
jgi:hypothetical protein